MERFSWLLVLLAVLVMAAPAWGETAAELNNPWGDIQGDSLTLRDPNALATPKASRNLLRFNDNTDLADTDCTNQGAAGFYAWVDGIKGTGEKLYVCKENALFWEFPDPSTTTTFALFATATSGVPIYRAIVQADVSDHTVYTAGDGLDLTASQFSADLDGDTLAVGASGLSFAGLPTCNADPPDSACDDTGTRVPMCITPDGTPGHYLWSCPNDGWVKHGTLVGGYLGNENLPTVLEPAANKKYTCNTYGCAIEVATVASPGVTQGNIAIRSSDERFCSSDGSQANCTLDERDAPSGMLGLSYGSGKDGDFDMSNATIADEDDCTNFCPTLCTGGCSYGGSTCTCSVDPNSYVGGYHYSECDDSNSSQGLICTSDSDCTGTPNGACIKSMPSVVWELTGYDLGSNHVIEISDKRTLLNGCETAVGTTFFIMVRGDFTHAGTLDLEGEGTCGGDGGGACAASTGKTGCSILFPAGTGGAQNADGGDGYDAAFDWIPGMPLPTLHGFGGPGATASGADSCVPFNLDIQPHASAMGGGGSGGSAGCNGSCSGNNGIPGHGGAGLWVVGTGTATISGTIDLDGTVITGGTTSIVGGASGGSGVVIFPTVTWNTPTVTVAGQNGGDTLGAYCGPGTGDSRSGGDGGDGAFVTCDIDSTTGAHGCTCREGNGCY